MNIDFIVRRAAIVKGIRSFFDAHGFLEVETPVRIDAPAPECHIDCPPVATGGFLRASPELQMKKLLASGLERIYQIGPCFRDGEKGSRHNPEFTMIEWYRRDATYLDIADDLEGLLRFLQQSSRPSDRRSLLKCSRMRVRDAYRDFAGWDPWTAWDQDRFDFDMATVVEPKLKEIGGGVFLMDYPVQASSLAVVTGDSAERWEFYWDGMELANCFTELCDEAEQRRRFAEARSARRALGESDYPLDESFLSSLAFIGSASGVALGVDRLVMVLCAASSITQVRVGV